jgi:cytoskeletal protein RodZ
VPDIGSTLREARMRARIDITEVETRTKIRAKYLRALENEEWDLLPGPIYVKSFLRTYGDYLGLDSRLLVEEFKRRYERPTDHELRPISSLRREQERHARGPLLPSWALIGLVLVGVLVVLYVVGNLGGGSKNPAPATAHRSKPHRHRPASKQTTPLPATPNSVTLKLVPTGLVYVCLVNGNGKKLINQQTYNVGQTVAPATAGKLLLTLGNSSVHVTVNGQPVPITPSPNPIRLMFDPTGHHLISTSIKPTCP